ncbi:MAG: hypothetical protein ACOYL3_28380 [Desulfuromonadaceae bacterium]
MRKITLIRSIIFLSLSVCLFLTLASNQAHCADIATVTKLNTVLRDGPSEDGEKVLLLKKKAVLALVDRENIDGWLNVIHIQTGKEGWIKAKHVSLALSKQPSRPPVFNEQKIDEYSNPEIEIENASDKDLLLKVGQERFEIQKHTTKSVSILPSDYKYHASAPGVFPAIGKKDFLTGYRYTWKFWIETRSR